MEEDIKKRWQKYTELYKKDLCIRWPKYWSFSFSISPSSEYSGLISFRINWLDLLSVQGTLKSLLQHHSLKASILWHSAFFMIQLSHPHMTTGKAIKCTSKLTWKSTWLYLRTFPVSHFGPICSRSSFLPKDVEENYNHSLTWAHILESNGRIMGLTVSFLVTLQRWTQCHRSTPLPLTSMGWPQRISRQKGGWSLHVSPGFPWSPAPSKKRKETEMFLL